MRGKGGKCKRKVALTAFSDILNVIGRATTKYKVVCLETLPWVGSWDNGAALIQLCSSLECLGYHVSSKELFAPDFGSSCARRIRYVVGIENSIAEVTGAFDFPLPNTAACNELWVHVWRVGQSSGKVLPLVGGGE